MDSNQDGYLDYNEFLGGLFKIYLSTFEQKIAFVFEIYDFDRDGFITKEDISSILSYMPVLNSTPVISEGKFTSEGGSATDFKDRVETLQ